MSFEKMKNRLGFGIMRLKMDGENIDYNEFNHMIDIFMDAGFNYFDTAHGYIDKKSEIAVRDCLTSRYNREDYVLANKLSEWFVKEEKDVIPFFENQLKACGVDYFDFYLCHALDRDNYPKYKSINAFGIIKELKKQGKVKHMAISFHDSADVLDAILNEQPDIEAVQLQINYLDYDDPCVQSRACYDVAAKHGKKIIVMEPVKGGALVNLPKEGAKVLDALDGGSYASYALRFVAEHPEVIMVLSGMGSEEMIKDNIKTMSSPAPLTNEERAVLKKVKEIIRKTNQIPCTGCNYCRDVCPQNIAIPGFFSAYNEVLGGKSTPADAKEKFPAEDGTITDCIKCKKCESVCPQNIEIPKHLEKIHEKTK